MNCLDARKRINRYILGDLSFYELQDFEAHINQCEECREELKVTKMVYDGVSMLQNDTEKIDLDQSFRKLLDENTSRLRLQKGLKIFKIFLETAASWAFLFLTLRFLFLCLG